ncbi:unnamed protein product [Boreogadus saida]
MSMNALLKILFLSGGVQRVRCLWQRPCWIHPDRTRPYSLHMLTHGKERTGEEYTRLLRQYGFGNVCIAHTWNFLVVVLAVKN